MFNIKLKMDNLRTAVKEGKVIIGTDKTLKLLRKGALKKVYLSKNCQDNVKEDIKHYGKLFNIEVKETNKTNEDLGVICKKPFSISVLGY